MPAVRRVKRAGPRSWRDRKRPAPCSSWKSIRIACGWFTMRMAVDARSRAGAHQPGFRAHANTFIIAIALEQFDQAAVNGCACVVPARPDEIADLHAVEPEAGGARGLAAGSADALLARPRSEARRVGRECVRTCSYRWSPSH